MIMIVYTTYGKTLSAKKTSGQKKNIFSEKIIWKSNWQDVLIQLGSNVESCIQGKQW